MRGWILGYRALSFFILGISFFAISFGVLTSESQAAIDREDARILKETRGILVFVPGTGNWLVPGSWGGEGGATFSSYFSSAILESARELGYEVYVIRNLKAFGSFEENGTSLLNELESWYQEYSKKNFLPANYQTPITLLGHSAGGFYSLYAASLRSSLPIQKIIVVGTPLSGTELADAFIDNLLKDKADPVFQSILKWVDLRGLLQMTSRHVEKFLRRLKISARIKIFAAGGVQPLPRSVKDWADFNYLCPVCEMMASFLPPEPSDGLVTLSSALGIRAEIRNKNGSLHPIHRLADLQPNLDHIEQLLDFRFYIATGILNSGEVEKEQRRFYSELLRRVQSE